MERASDGDSGASGAAPDGGTPDRALDRAPDRAPVEVDGRGRALIAGTAIEAHRIAALLDGDMDVEEVLHDYISLDRGQVLAAKAYADAHPWTGTPFPRLTAKKAMREAKLDDLIRYLPRRAR